MADMCPAPGPGATSPALSEVRVSGGSDDIIELRGAIVDDWYHYRAEPARIVFDNGVIIDIEYDRDSDGIWRTTIVAGHSHARILACPDPTGEDTYTDTAVITGARTATCGEHTATTIYAVR